MAAPLANFGADGFKDPDTKQEKSSRGVIEEAEALRKKLKNKKRKYKQYKEKYPQNVPNSAEFGQQKAAENHVFIPPAQQVNDLPTVGSGVVYKTTELAKDDNTRIQSLVPRKLVVSNPFVTYKEEDVTLVIQDKDQQFVPTFLIPDAAGNRNAAGAVAEIGVSFLRGVSSFITLALPPDIKNYDDYLDDIRRFDLGTKQTRLKLALGQSTLRPWLTVQQLSLNQAFYLTESKFTPASGATDQPLTIDIAPRIVLFYKKFLDCDPAWESTIPGGREVYHGRFTKENVLKLMKVYNSSPYVVNLDNQTASGTIAVGGGGLAPINAHLTNPPSIAEVEAAKNERIADADLQRAFQNLDMTDDAYEQFQHIMASFYIMLTTSIAEFYMASKAYQSVRNNVSAVGYPPGLITPQIINKFLSDEGFEATAELGEISRMHLVRSQNPYGIAWAAARCAIRGAQNGPHSRDSRIYKDGNEFINGLAPTKFYSNLAVDAGVNFNAAEVNQDQGSGYFKNWSSRIRRHAPVVQLNINGVQMPLQNVGFAVLDPNAVRAANQLIATQFDRIIQPTLDPTGTGIFAAWGANNGNIPVLRNEPRDLRLQDRSGDVKAKETRRNGPIRMRTRERMRFP